MARRLLLRRSPWAAGDRAAHVVAAQEAPLSRHRRREVRVRRPALAQQSEDPASAGRDCRGQSRAQTDQLFSGRLGMSDLPARYDRNIRLFGEEGQSKLRATNVAVIGVGGLGSPLVQHLALLGVSGITPVDDEELDETNRNRFVGARHDDPVPGSPKVELAARLVHEIDPTIRVTPVRASLISEEVFATVKQADWVFGCFDEDGPRAILNELCAAYAKSYIDLASDVPEEGVYGGRICVAWQGGGCLHCLDALDPRDVEAYLSTDAEKAGRAAIYGVPVEVVRETGPSVSPINGVAAALAATEFMVAVTGMREPQRLINYYGHVPKLTTAKPKPDCYYCKGIRGKPQDADAERFLRMPHLRERRRKQTR
ncbi:ThiF family adenylyltransferase [Bradyrhizobium sp. RP6]|nr:ThiF family adenylyltransferase [Bradyrhizobium sp. RP6]